MTVFFFFAICRSFKCRFINAEKLTGSPGGPGLPSRPGGPLNSRKHSQMANNKNKYINRQIYWLDILDTILYPGML